MISLAISDMKKYGHNPKHPEMFASAGWWKTEKRYPMEYCHLLSSMAASTCRGCEGDVVEVGTDYALSTLALAYGIRDFKDIKTGTKPRKVITFDVREKIVTKAIDRAKKLEVDNIQFVLSESSAVKDYTDHIAFGYIDGCHTFMGCYKDIQNLAPLLDLSGIILFHDVHDEIPDPTNPKANGVKQAIQTYMMENPGWVATRFFGFGLLGRVL